MGLAEFGLCFVCKTRSTLHGVGRYFLLNSRNMVTFVLDYAPRLFPQLGVMTVLAGGAVSVAVRAPFQRHAMPHDYDFFFIGSPTDVSLVFMSLLRDLMHMYTVSRFIFTDRAFTVVFKYPTRGRGTQTVVLSFILMTWHGVGK